MESLTEKLFIKSDHDNLSCVNKNKRADSFYILNFLAFRKFYILQNKFKLLWKFWTFYIKKIPCEKLLPPQMHLKSHLCPSLSLQYSRSYNPFVQRGILCWPFQDELISVY